MRNSVFWLGYRRNLFRVQFTRSNHCQLDCWKWVAVGFRSWLSPVGIILSPSGVTGPHSIYERISRKTLCDDNINPNDKYHHSLTRGFIGFWHNVRVYVCVYICTHMGVYVCIYVYGCICACVLVYIYQLHTYQVTPNTGRTRKKWRIKLQIHIWLSNI